MKKLLVGCLVVVVLLGIAGVVGAYFLWRAAKPMVESATALAGNLTRFSEAAALEDRLTSTARYQGPASDEITPAQLERFLRVQAHVKRTLGERAEAFKEKYKEIGSTRPDGTETPPSLSQLLAGLSDLSGIYLEARRAQVDALNTEGFSREEYSWVRTRVYQAAGVEVVRFEPRELERLLKQAAAGTEVDAPDVRLPDVPAANRALVKPHAAQLMEWVAMASFGL
jgi:hypothetical protein